MGTRASLCTTVATTSLAGSWTGCAHVSAGAALLCVHAVCGCTSRHFAGSEYSLLCLWDMLPNIAPSRKGAPHPRGTW